MVFVRFLPFNRSKLVERRFTIRADARATVVVDDGKRGFMNSGAEIVRRRAGTGFGILGFDIIPGPHCALRFSIYNLAACVGRKMDVEK